MEITGPIIVAIICAAAFAIYVIYAIVKGQRQRPSTGVEEMIGKEATVQTTLDPRGTVLAEGELWTAIAEDSTIESGEEVIITKVEGLKLWVARKPKE